jgi:hypothetical protein
MVLVDMWAYDITTYLFCISQLASYVITNTQPTQTPYFSNEKPAYLNNTWFICNDKQAICNDNQAICNDN